MRIRGWALSFNLLQNKSGHASLTLWKCGGIGSGAVIEAHKVTEGWHSESIIWNDQPDFATKVEDYANIDQIGSYNWVLTDLVKDWYANENNGLILKAPNNVESGGTVNWQGYYSIDNTDVSETVRPYLYITFRNTNGLESYWDYTALSAGRAGTGYVNNYSGNLVWVHNDIGFGGNRMPVSISHIYNTNDAVPILNSDGVQINNTNPFGLGNGWRTNYNQTISVYEANSDYYVWDDADGTKHYFVDEDADGVWRDEDNLNLILEFNPSGYTIKDQLGNQSIFDSYGRLVKIQNNQLVSSSIDVTYENSTSKRITKITDGVGRVYDFTYTNGLLTRISYTGTGTTELAYVRFEYSGNNLFKIIDQDGKTVQYTYYNSSLLTCKDIDGYLITFEYCGTYPKRLYDAFTYKGTEAGGSLTFEYAHNQTTITDHNGNSNILQFNDWGNVTCIQDNEGRAQYAQYAKNIYRTEKNSSNRANQMTLSSKLQDTVINLFRDNSFELETTWSNLSTNVTNVASEDTAFYGRKSLKMTATGAGGIRYTGGTFYGSDTFTFSAYVKTDSTAQAWLAITTSTGMSATSEVLESGSDWTRLQVSITPTENCNIYAQLMTDTAGSVYMDCVTFERAAIASRFNLVDNGDFRYQDYNWTQGTNLASTDQYATLSAAAAPRMSSGVYKMEGSPTAVKQLYQEIQVSGNEGDTFILSGWAKGDSVPITDDNRTFRLRLKFNYINGTGDEKDFVADFNPATGTANKWQFASVPAVAKGTYSSVTVYLEYSYNANTAYFDGIQLFKEEFGSTYTYDDNGNVVSVIDLQKQETNYTYDANNNLVQVAQNGQPKMTYNYNEWNNLTRAVTAEGVTYRFTYNEHGSNLATIVEHNGSRITTLTRYTDDGNYLNYTQDALGKRTYYGYDPDTGVLEWVQYPEDTEATRTEYTYDSMYRLATAAADIDADTTLTASYTYNNDLLTQLTTGSTTYSFAYNNFGQRTSISIGTRNLASYTYTNDQNRYLSQLVYGNQDMVQYTYDNLGRVVLETYEDGSTVAYAYDNTGALATVTDSETGIKTTYYYDFTDRLMKYVEKGTNSSHSVQYDYDVQNRLTKLVETINGVDHETTYTYDEDNRVTGMNSNGVAHTVIYDAFGRVSETAITNPNITKSFTYETNSSQLKGLTVRFRRTIHAWTYTYDDNGNILSAYDDRDGDSYTYTYDSANQLIGASCGITFWEWTYDDSGNILSRKEYNGPTLVDTVIYSYTDSSWGDLLTAYDGTTIQYDAIGNPTNYGDWHFFWKHGRQLEAMVGSNLISFTYDANGMRKTKDVDGTTYTYLYNGSQLTQMTRSDGNTLFFTYDTFGHPATVDWNGTVYYIVTNLQGDVLSIRDSSGTSLVEYRYDPWGKILSITGSMAGTLGTLNPLTYRGYVYDHETGLYYLQSRYYNPEWGRFLNADALIATGQGMLGNNMFAYCNNNPVNNIDCAGNAPSKAIFPVCIGGSGPNYTLETSTDGKVESEELLEYLTSGINPNYICPQNGRVTSISVQKIEDYYNPSYPVVNKGLWILSTVSLFIPNPVAFWLGLSVQTASGYFILTDDGDPVPTNIEYNQFHVTLVWESAEYQNGRIAYNNNPVTWVFIYDHSNKDNEKWLCIGQK